MNKKPEISDIAYSIINPDGTTSLDKDLYIKDLDEYFTSYTQEEVEAARTEGFDDGYGEGFDAGTERAASDIVTMIRANY